MSVPESLEVKKEMEIQASPEIVWESLLEEIGPAQSLPDGTPMPMKLEAFPGGRWWRDLGNGAGHWWGTVQVIKAPKLLEIAGPMFMSYPVASHVQWKISGDGSRSSLVMTHRAVGLIDPEHRKGVDTGWGMILNRVKERAARASKR